ncbi:MAG: cyclic lactone autoinducer peptide [Anaeromicrobium sp.]|jgi:cyclic lactone autoinducer peptide|nr:cyclic lactone autoinducer peptide [Anaeromicrobium sp.]MCT4594546.1 cyclic lactone autoinducer peptide [Anaeromicrobium sp.]
MKNKLFKLAVVLGSGVFALLANATAASACAWGSYQPEEPKCLRDE